jgi:hypothetical protein
MTKSGVLEAIVARTTVLRRATEAPIHAAAWTKPEDYMAVDSGTASSGCVGRFVVRREQTIEMVTTMTSRER